MTIFKSQSGKTALKIIDEITSMYGACYRLDSNLWHHVGNTEPFDPTIDSETMENMCIDNVEQLDTQNFDLSKSMAEVSDKELL